MMCCCSCRVTNNKPIVVQLNGIDQTSDSSDDRLHFKFTNPTSVWGIFDDLVELLARNHNVSFYVYRQSQKFAVHRPV